jgi:hypothetical protein
LPAAVNTEMLRPAPPRAPTRAMRAALRATATGPPSGAAATRQSPSRIDSRASGAKCELAQLSRS